VIIALGMTLALPVASAAGTTSHAVTPHASGAIVGDYNGDGLPDTAILNSGNGPTCSVTVQLGLAGGGFGPARTHSYTTIDTTEPCPDQGVAMKLGNQKRSDLVVGFSFGVGHLMVLHNFLPVALVSGLIQPSVMRVQDINGDGRPDLVEISDQVDEMRTLINTPAATLVSGPFGACTVDRFGFPQYALADFDGDGTMDMVLATYCPPSIDPDTVQVQFGDGHAPATLVNTSVNPLDSFTAFVIDIDYDGIPDVGVIQSGPGIPTTVSYFHNDGHGNFTPAGGQ
jgi:hypothetical protein